MARQRRTSVPRPPAAPKAPTAATPLRRRLGYGLGRSLNGPPRWCDRVEVIGATIRSKANRNPTPRTRIREKAAGARCASSGQRGRRIELLSRLHHQHQGKNGVDKVIGRGMQNCCGRHGDQSQHHRGAITTWWARAENRSASHQQKAAANAHDGADEAHNEPDRTDRIADTYIFVA